jgi:hypothetical protein
MKELKLSKPVTGARGPVSVLRFREPNFSDWTALGDPEGPLWMGTGEGRSLVIQQFPQIIGQYAEKLLVDEDVNLLSLLGLRDALRLKDLVLGFFREAESPASSDASPTS